MRSTSKRRRGDRRRYSNVRESCSRRSTRPSSAKRCKNFDAVVMWMSRERDRKSTRLNSSHANISYAVFCLMRLPTRFTLFPYTTLFRSVEVNHFAQRRRVVHEVDVEAQAGRSQAILERPRIVFSSFDQAEFREALQELRRGRDVDVEGTRSEEHTSELQSRQYLVCRLLLDASTNQIYTLSLHDALPICRSQSLRATAPCRP